MKNDDLNLDMLENADERTVERLSEEYSAVTESDVKRLYEKSEKLYNSRKTDFYFEPQDTVTGVEPYRRPMWSKVLAAVSALVLVTGAVTGGALLIRNFSGRPDDTLTDTTEEESAACRNIAPFGDISEARVRFTNAAYVPYLYEATAEEVSALAEAFNLAAWEEIPADTPLESDGETALVYVNADGQTYRLVFNPDGTVECVHDGVTTKYKVSEAASSAAYSGAQSDNIYGRLIPCKVEDLTADGVWKNSEIMPEKLFDEPALTEELEGKYIIENHPLYDFAWDIEDVRKDAANADNIIIGTVDSVSFKSSGGIAHMVIDIIVSEDTAGKFTGGKFSACNHLTLGILGGYVPMKEIISDPSVQAHASPDGSELKDYDVDNTYYHEIVGTGLAPIVGKEYAFLTHSDETGCSIVGEEYGILYKCDNLYISHTSMATVNEFFDLDELKAMLGGELSADALPYINTEKTTEEVHVESVDGNGSLVVPLDK